MTDISSLVTEDGRSLYEKMRRNQIYRLADKAGIPYKAGTPKDALIPVLEANNVNPFLLEDEWEDVIVTDEDGRSSVTKYPKIKPHATAGREIDYYQEIEKRSAKADADNKALEDSNAALKDQVANLTAMMEKLMAQNMPKVAPKETNIHEMTMPQLRELAKERGIKMEFGQKKSDLIEKLNG